MNLQQMVLNYTMIFTMTLTASFAAFFLKKSTDGTLRESDQSKTIKLSFRSTLFSIIKNKFLYIGGFMYVFAALINIWLLKRMPYSVVIPLGSICYIWTMIIACIFLKEKIGAGKIIGVLLILGGVVCIAL